MTRPVLRTGPAPAARPIRTELAKAVLIDTATGAGHPVMYNPEELKLEQGNQFAEVAVPGRDTSPVQYVRGRNRVLTMELFFDTYETGEDVRVHTAPIVALLDRQSRTLAPPVLLFSLGRLQFRCVLTEAGQRFTMFDRDGTPVRSTMTVSLQEYEDIALDIRQGVFLGSPTASAVVDQVVGGGAAAVVHIVTQGDTLSAIAGVYLGDPARWREIATANRIVDPLGLTPGVSLVIPGGTR
jgi:nucleoid-associated protein YgaU